MLISHTLKYLPAQVLAPVAQLVSMILWTHWLAPDEMGLFTLVTVAQEMAYVFCLGWFSVYALRYLPARNDHAASQTYLGTENAVVLASIVAGLAAALLKAVLLPDLESFWRTTLAIAFYFVSRALNTHYAERARAQSAFLAYTLLQAVGPVGGLALGWLALEWIKPDAVVLLAAYGVAQTVGCLLALPLLGMSWRLVRPDGKLLRDAVAFGLPMLGLGVLSWTAENYIRYLVQWQSGATTLGLMVVGWALGRRCTSVAAMMVATAAFPLAARLLNEGRRDEALAQLALNVAIVLATLLPVTVGLYWLGPVLTELTVGAEYRELSADMLVLSVVGGALRNLHMHGTDQILVLDRRLGRLAVIDVVEIVLCAGASLAGLLHAGLHGAVLGQALGSLLTLMLSMHWSRALCGFQWPWLHTLKIGIATAAMALVLSSWAVVHSAVGLLFASLVGAFSYTVVLGLLFLPELRRWRAAHKLQG